jgi:hypothetical protein
MWGNFLTSWGNVGCRWGAPLYILYFLDYGFLVLIPATRLQHKTVRRVTEEKIVSEMEGPFNHTRKQLQPVHVYGWGYVPEKCNLERSISATWISTRQSAPWKSSQMSAETLNMSQVNVQRIVGDQNLLNLQRKTNGKVVWVTLNECL